MTFLDDPHNNTSLFMTEIVKKYLISLYFYLLPQKSRKL